MAFARGRKGARKDPRKGVKRRVFNLPDELDLKLRQDKIDKLSKTLDENGRAKPLTENKLKDIIRSAVREKWMYSPQKLAFREKRKEPDIDPTSRRLWRWKCDICGGWFGADEIDIDHIKGNHSFVKLEDAHKWATSILDVGGDEDLQVLCNDECHPIKTAMEDLGCTWEEAVLYKRMTLWEASMKSIASQKKFLLGKGFSEKEISNKPKRRAAYTEFLKREEKTWI